jgi:hypothetical protein
VKFERYADDVIAHCRTEKEAQEMRKVIRARTDLCGGCVKTTRKRHAVRKMKVGPSEPPCRGRLQTAISCFGQKPWW